MLATAKVMDVTRPAAAASRLEPTLLGVALFSLAAIAACAMLWRRRE